MSHRVVLTIKTEDGATLRLAGTCLSTDALKLGKDFMAMCDRYRAKVSKGVLP